MSEASIEVTVQATMISEKRHWCRDCREVTPHRQTVDPPARRGPTGGRRR